MKYPKITAMLCLGFKIMILLKYMLRTFRVCTLSPQIKKSSRSIKLWIYSINSSLQAILRKRSQKGLNVVFDFSQISFMHKPGKRTVLYYLGVLYIPQYLQGVLCIPWMF